MTRIIELLSIRNEDNQIEIIQQLQNCGVHLSVDNFGASHASLRCIKDLKSFSGPNSFAIFSTSSEFKSLTLSKLSTNNLYPLAVGTRPADVWGESSKPKSSRSAMTLRIVAGLKFNDESLERVREPTGAPS